jgi:hypothetical protein
VASPVLWEVSDGRGRIVQMREKQLNHLLDHTSMHGEEDAIRLTISDPDVVVRPTARAKGRGIERRVNCRRGAHSRYKWLYILVPIDYGRQENWVVTAYPSANLPKGDLLYVRIPFRES